MITCIIFKIQQDTPRGHLFLHVLPGGVSKIVWVAYIFAFLMLITARVTPSLFWSRLSTDNFIETSPFRCINYENIAYLVLVVITNIQIVVISPLLDGSTQPTKESCNQLIANWWFMLTNQCAKRSPNADKTFYTCTYYTNKRLKFKTFHIFCKIFIIKKKNVHFMSRSSFCGSILSYEITENRIRGSVR